MTEAAMDPNELPLRDYHLPEAIGWWPPAPGWWGLLVLLWLAVTALWWWRRTYRRRQPARQAAAELARIRQHWQRHGDRRDTLQAVSVLLRRIAASSHNGLAVSLQGQDWLRWLDGAHPNRPFSEGPGRLLLNGPYLPAGQGDRQQIEALLALIDQHIRRVKGWSC